MQTPYWIAFGDIHDDISALAALPDLEAAAGVIITGDMTVGGGVKQAARVLEKIAARNPGILAQIGNMDRPEVTDWLREKDWNIHVATRFLAPGIAVMGLGAAPFTPFGTPSEYPESHLAAWLETAHRDAPPYEHLVLVSHAPPFGTACDRLHNGVAVGSKAVREFIEDVQPAICLCGHIHESRAVDRLGKTVVINPGAFISGGYVVLFLRPEGPVAELRGV